MIKDKSTTDGSTSNGSNNKTNPGATGIGVDSKGQADLTTGQRAEAVLVEDDASG